MPKVSLGKSTDPRQQQLREEKAAFNKEMSGFITDLIQFKKLMNGHPNKFYMQKGRIIDEIPSNPASIISELASNFNDLAQKGNEIISEQIEYSKTRRKPITASEEAELIVEASNKLTRFISKLKGPYFGDSFEKSKKEYRLRLLSMFEGLYYLFKQLESNVLSSDKESLIAAGKNLQKINLTLDKIVEQTVNTIELLKIKQKKTVDDLSGKDPIEPLQNDNVPVELAITPEPEDKKEEGDLEPEPIKQDIKHMDYIENCFKTYKRVMSSDNLDLIEIYKLNKGFHLLEKEVGLWKFLAKSSRTNTIKPLTTIVNFIKHLPVYFADKPFKNLGEYNQYQAIPALEEGLDPIPNISAYDLYTFEDKNLFVKDAKKISDLEKFADGIIEKQLKLLKHKLPLFKDKNSVNRLEVYDQSKLAREKIDKVFDLLESKDFTDYESLLKFKKSIESQLAIISKNLQILGFDENINIFPIDYDRLAKRINNPVMYEELKDFPKEEIEKAQELEHRRRLRSIFKS